MISCSVIIPLYNKGSRVRRALSSVLKQSFTEYEIIVIDDGSTDDGPTIIKKEFNDPRIKLIRQENAGPGAARNRGVKEAKGEFVAFLDADDEWLPDFLDVSISNLKKHTDCVLSVCSFYRDKEGEKSTLNHTAKLSEGVWFLPEKIEPLQFDYIISSLHSAGAVLCKRDIVERYDGFYENKCCWGEDRYLWLKVLLNHKIYYEPRPLFCYHFEDSELASKRYHHEVWPALRYPEDIYNVCPASHKKKLEQYLAWAVLVELSCLFTDEKVEYFKSVLDRHKKVFNYYPMKYLLLRFKFLVPKLVTRYRKRKYGI